ncbi:hypothetical protein GGF44_005443, partial [Coemansia sp. RSA 1694]
RYFYYHAIDLTIAERIYYDCIKQQTANRFGRVIKNNYFLLLTQLLRLRQTTSHPLITSAQLSDDSSGSESESENSGATRFGLLEASMPILLSVNRFWMFTEDTMRNVPIGSVHAGLEPPDKCAHCDGPIYHLKGIWVHRCGSEKSTLPENGGYFARCISDKLSYVSPDMIEQFQRVYSSEGSTGSSSPSSKMRRILSILMAMRRSDPEDKCVVFWTMSKRQRDEALASFASDKNIPVLILSKRAGAVGINLTAANHVILESAWWNPSIDSQAVDRAYRIGQTKNVHVHILIAQNTVDEKMHAIQESKKGLIDSIIGHAKDDRKKLTTSDILRMLQIPLDAVI